MSKFSRRALLGGLSSVAVAAAAPASAWLRVKPPPGCTGYPTFTCAPPDAVPTLTPAYFASSQNPQQNPATTPNTNLNVATPWANRINAGYDVPTSFGAHLLTAQPQEPTTLYGSGYMGKMVLKLDVPDRYRVPAGSNLRITAGAGNIDPGKGWFKQVDFYAVGDLDGLGNTSHGAVKVTATKQVKNTRPCWNDTFFTCGYACDLDNSNPPPQDRYVMLTAVGTPVNGYARRTQPIILLLEGSQRLAPLGSGSSAQAVDAYVDEVAGIDGPGYGTASAPCRTIGYGMTVASAWPVGSVFVQSSASAPAHLDYTYGKDAQAYAGAATCGWDAKIVRPWTPGTVLYLARSAYGSIDAARTVHGTNVAQPDQVFVFNHNRVVVQNASIEMSYIVAFGAASPPYHFYGAQIGFDTVKFTNALTANDQNWLGPEVITGTALLNSNGNSGGPQYAFFRNCNGRLGSSGNMDLIAGGHFDISWDAGNIGNRQTTFAFFDYEARQISFTQDMGSGGDIAVASIIRDPVGQRTVIRFAPEDPGVHCKVSIATNAGVTTATVSCYADAALTVPKIPTNLRFAVSQAPLVTFNAESGNPLAGLTFPVGSFSNGCQFTMNVTDLGTTSFTSGSTPYHFTFNSLLARNPQGNSGQPVVNGGEGCFAVVTSGAAKKTHDPAGGITVAGMLKYSTPEYANNYSSPCDGLLYLGVSDGRGALAGSVPPANAQLQYNRGAASRYGLPLASLSGNTLTFASATPKVVSDFTLSTVSDAHGKRATLSGSLPLGVGSMGIKSSAGTSGWQVGDYFYISGPQGTPITDPGVGALGKRYAIGRVKTVDGNGGITGITTVYSGEYTVGPYQPCNTSYLSSPFTTPEGTTFTPPRTDGSTPTGSITVTIAGGFSSPVIPGASIYVGGRLIGQVANNVNNGSSTDANGVPAYSFYLANWDGGADLNGAASWTISYDLHGFSVGDNLALPTSVDSSGLFYTVMAVNGPVVTLDRAPSVSVTTGLVVTGYLGTTARQMVVLERYFDDYGQPQAKLTDGLAAGDTLRISAYVQHSDRFQIAEPSNRGTMGLSRLEGSLMSCCRTSGNDWQPIQHAKMDKYSVGTMTLHAAGDGFGVGDGRDVSFTLPTLPLTVAPGNAVSMVWIDGKSYSSYTFAFDQSIVLNPDGSTSQYRSFYNSTTKVTTYYYMLTSAGGAVTWTDASGNTIAAPVTNGFAIHPGYATLGQQLFYWSEPRRVMRIKFLTRHAGSSFRLYAASTSGTIWTVTYLDDRSVFGGGNADFVIGDKLQHPLPVDDGTQITLCGSNTAAPLQGRIFTNDPNNPGVGRVHRAFSGAMAAPGAYGPISAGNLTNETGFDANSWGVLYQVKDHVFLATTCATLLPGQVLNGLTAGGGIESAVSWNNVGWVQCSEAVAGSAALQAASGIYSIDQVHMKGGTFCMIGVIDTLHGGFDVALTNGTASAGLDLQEALFANSNFANLMRSSTQGADHLTYNNTSDTSAATVLTKAAVAAMGCTLDTYPSFTYVDPATNRPTTNLSSIPRIAAGTVQFPWSAYGEDIANDGTALIGARQAA